MSLLLNNFLRLLLTVAAAILLLLPAQAVTAPKTITIAADVWCPINCAPDSDKLGIGVDTAKKIFEPLGYEVKYVVMPWSRALEGVRTGKINAAIGANRQDDPSLLLPRSPITDITDGLYVLAGSKLNFKTIDSLRGTHLGIIHGYGYSNEIKQFIAENQKIPGVIQEVGGDNALEQNIRKLMAGRIDVLVESNSVMAYTTQRLKLGQKIKRIGGFRQGPVYLAFSPALPESQSLIALYEKGLTKLRSSGELKEIYQPYGLSPEGP